MLRFTPEKLREMRGLARRHLYFFQRALLGDHDLKPDFHGDLCAFLQGLPPYEPFPRKLIVGWRGCLKTSGLRAFMWWMGLHAFDPPNAEGVSFIPNFSCFFVEQKYENAEAHHRMLQQKFRTGPQAALLQDIYRDRIEGVFDNWTVKRTYLNQTDANEEPFITIGSLDAKLEGGHKHAIFCDDLEGADANLSDVPNRQAATFIFDRAPHLLKHRYTGLIYDTGTPHGAKPSVWTIRDYEEGGTLDNSKRKYFHIWWKECLNQDDHSNWEKRFPTANLHLERDLAERFGGDLRRAWDTQMMLRRHSKGGRKIAMERVAEGFFSQQYVRLHGVNRLLMFYKRDFFRGTSLAPGREPKLQHERGQIDVAACRSYLHADPAHKSSGERITSDIPSKWAVITTLVSPDWHAFAVDVWIKRNVEYDDFLNEWLRQYRKWCPRVAGSCTFDPVGAQTWFRHDLRHLEQWKYQNRIYSLPTPWRKKPISLPRPSTQIVDAHKSGRAKIEHITEQLSPWVNFGWLHLRDPQSNYQDDTDELLREMNLLGTTDKESFDGCDALAQGPGVWEPPPSPEAIKARRMRTYLRQLIAGRDPTGYDRPWQEQR